MRLPKVNRSMPRTDNNSKPERESNPNAARPPAQAPSAPYQNAHRGSDKDANSRERLNRWENEGGSTAPRLGSLPHGVTNGRRALQGAAHCDASRPNTSS
jgi:hypothetical protein